MDIDTEYIEKVDTIVRTCVGIIEDEVKDLPLIEYLVFHIIRGIIDSKMIEFGIYHGMINNKEVNFIISTI